MKAKNLIIVLLPFFVPILINAAGAAKGDIYIVKVTGPKRKKPLASSLNWTLPEGWPNPCGLSFRRSLEARYRWSSMYHRPVLERLLRV